MNRQAHHMVRFIVLAIFLCIMGAVGLLIYTGYSSIMRSLNDNGTGAYDLTTSGITSRTRTYNDYITPDSPAVRELVSDVTSIEEAYDIANRWIYISEEKLHGIIDKWLTPEEFLTESPYLNSNPVPGEVIGDCEEQANTLASMIRAMGVSPDDVRVVLGIVETDEINKGHVWVEVYQNGYWLALDPSQGPRWDEILNRLDTRFGLEFDYYEKHTYPISKITAYYNDRYYSENKGFMEGVPETWNHNRTYELTSN